MYSHTQSTSAESGDSNSLSVQMARQATMTDALPPSDTRSEVENSNELAGPQKVDTFPSSPAVGGDPALDMLQEE